LGLLQRRIMRDGVHEMMILCGQSNPIWHYFAGAYPGSVGTLMGPSYLSKVPIRWWMPYALDNDAFMAWSAGREWDEAAWFEMLGLVSQKPQKPLWVLVPDKVGDRQSTLDMWDKYSPHVIKRGFNAAFACQDGMTLADMPDNASILFIGGTTDWKWETLPMWCESGRRIHVGRVNTMRQLLQCDRLGVESVDGSGWFRDTSDGIRINQLTDYIQNGVRQVELLLK